MSPPAGRFMGFGAEGDRSHGPFTRKMREYFPWNPIGLQMGFPCTHPCELQWDVPWSMVLIVAWKPVGSAVRFSVIHTHRGESYPVPLWLTLHKGLSFSKRCTGHPSTGTSRRDHYNFNPMYQVCFIAVFVDYRTNVIVCRTHLI